MNGKIIREMGTKIDPESDQISLDGKLLSEVQGPPKVYWMLHKPDMCLTSRKAEEGKATIFDLPALRSVKFLLYPVGRLDFRTEGLLLLSNDGELVHRLTHPSYKLPRTYQVLVSRKLTAEEESTLRKGIILDDGPTQGVDLEFLQSKEMGSSKGAFYRVIVREGRNRIVRRLFEFFDVKVVRLIRLSFDDISLPDDLKPGEYRQLSSQQIQKLKQKVQL